MLKFYVKNIECEDFGNGAIVTYSTQTISASKISFFIISALIELLSVWNLLCPIIFLPKVSTAKIIENKLFLLMPFMQLLVQKRIFQTKLSTFGSYVCKNSLDGLNFIWKIVNVGIIYIRGLSFTYIHMFIHEHV